MIIDISKSQSLEQLGLILLAILCYQRLLPLTLNDSRGPVNGLYLVDFDALLKGEPLGNEQAVSERMVLSFLRILETDTLIDEGLEIRQFATAVLDRSNLPVLNVLDGFLDQYMICRARSGCTYKDALERLGILFLMQLTVAIDRVKNWIPI
jgi:hypothetical protein